METLAIIGIILICAAYLIRRLLTLLQDVTLCGHGCAACGRGCGHPSGTPGKTDGQNGGENPGRTGESPSG